MDLFANEVNIWSNFTSSSTVFASKPYVLAKGIYIIFYGCYPRPKVNADKEGGGDMLANKTAGKGLNKKAVKAMACLARGIAKDSVDGRCWWFIHQPAEPKDLARRLGAMKRE